MRLLAAHAFILASFGAQSASALDPARVAQKITPKENSREEADICAGEAGWEYNTLRFSKEVKNIDYYKSRSVLWNAVAAIAYHTERQEFERKILPALVEVFNSFEVSGSGAWEFYSTLCDKRLHAILKEAGVNAN